MDHRTGIGITLTINGGANPRFPSPYDAKKLHDSYRREARSYHGDLVEAEPRKANGVFFNLVTMKFPLGSLHTPPDGAPGFAYQMNAIIPTAKASYVLQVGTMESQPTGTREAAGIIIYMNEKKIADLAVAAKTVQPGSLRSGLRRRGHVFSFGRAQIRQKLSDASIEPVRHRWIRYSIRGRSLTESEGWLYLRKKRPGPAGPANAVNGVSAQECL